MNYDYIHNYSEDEFEDIQSHYDGKAEYDNGLIFLSSTTSIKHNEIKRNILTEMSICLKGSKCKVYDEQIEVIFNYRDDTRKYKPDIFVMCEEVTKKGESFTSAPKLIFEILSKSITTDVLKLIQESIETTRIQMDFEEAKLLWPKVKQFVHEKGREPDLNSLDFTEKRLAECVIYIKQQKRKRVPA